MLYLPAGAARMCALVVSPLFEEKRSAHRALATCARALAAAGALTLLPDLSATGNSAGMLAEIGITQWMDDLRAAEELLRARDDAPLCLIGCRAGALLAARALAEGLPAARLLLWQPVTAGKQYLRQLRTRRNIQDSLTGHAPTTVGAYEIEGQELSAALFADLQALRLPDDPPPSELRLLQCSFTTTLLSEYARLAAHWGKDRLRVRCLVVEPFWRLHTPGAYTELAAALVEEALC